MYVFIDRNWMYLPVSEGDKHLTLTAAVRHRFNTEAAILDDTISEPKQGGILKFVMFWPSGLNPVD